MDAKLRTEKSRAGLPAGAIPKDAPLNALTDSTEDASKSVVQGDSADTHADMLEVSLRIAVPPERVFQLLTDPDHIGLWFAQVSGIEPRVGGAVEFVFFNENGSVSVFSGEITAFQANARFGFTWHNRQWTFPPLHVLITLESAGAATLLRLRQTGFAKAPPLERDIHDEGWARYLERLAAVADGTRPEGWNA
ncbi:MAG: SRPBCC domain-containing protein [Chloroflexi bacterium]|nr:SRPBCC domain-containing protein [Chloroflexota bacterium]